ncbi:MAG: formylmethanofuran dehydrogenase subunit E family protein [Oculatellaceae cyanobacterium Prado106]|jgi:formylmethanofuran dehydrogenase subunit E|nr:formylmethanofuran dehydrogenase subunit E family protein [Oculatellaceae cyanobacterium Prado106]
MIKGINTLSWVAILCGILGFDGSQIATATNGTSRDSAQDKFTLLNNHQQLALQPTRPTETPDQWVELGRRVHGGFGSYIALGIRIGLDAMQRLDAAPRTLDVTYYSGAIAPCPCVADGIMIATTSTPGQNLLRVATTTSPEGTFGVAEIRVSRQRSALRNRTTGTALRYTIPTTAKTQLDSWNQNTTGRQRYDAVMSASEETLFSVEVIP